MNLTWLNNGFICKDLCAPLVLEKDSEYFDDLKRKYKIVIQQARVAGPMMKALRYSGHLKIRYWK